MHSFAQLAQSKVDRQTTENIKPTPGPGDQNILTVGESIENGQIQLHIAKLSLNFGRKILNRLLR
jgi:hypothetical protein